MKNGADLSYPRRGFTFGRWLGRGALRCLGWRLSGPLPDLPKAILIVAPHTSNWDFVIGMAAALALDLDADWLAKKSLFRGPWGRLLRWLGGLPVDRSQSSGVIEQVAAICADRESILLAITPEGTRRARSRWKTGFYYLARAAELPLVPIVICYPEKLIRIHPAYRPGPDPEAELQRLMEYFHAGQARRPENFCPPAPVSTRTGTAPR